MEGAGLYAAAQRHKTDWILIKAITDWADGKKSAGEPGHQQMAARNAAAFALHVIEQGGWVDQAPLSSAEQLQASVDEPVTTPAPTPRLEELTLSQLRQLLHDGMSTAELQTMCFDLSIDPEDLSSSGKSALVRELISYLQRRKSLALLFDWLQQHRPDITP